MNTRTSPMAEWTAAADKVTRLVDELKQINDRREADGDSPALKERGENLMRGIVAAKAAEKDLQRAVIMSIDPDSIESGDGSDDRKHYRKTFGGAGSSAASPLADAILDAGFNLKSAPSVEFSAYDALKAPTWPAVTDWNRSTPQVVPLGQDTRFLWPFLPTENAGSNASIQDFRQTVRDVTGTVQRTLNATTDKANVDTTTTLVNEALVQCAVTIDDIPNAVLESVPRFSAYMESEGTFQVQKAIDAHIYAQILAASPANLLEGTNIISQLRNGIGVMRAVGATPRLAVLNPTDSAALDLLQESDGAYLFPTSATGTASPLWGLRVVERIGAGTEEPTLIDPGMLGVLYLGQMRVDADPYTGFKKNLTTLRFEVNGLYHVRNAQGALLIEAD